MVKPMPIRRRDMAWLVCNTASVAIPGSSVDIADARLAAFSLSIDRAKVMT